MPIVRPTRIVARRAAGALAVAGVLALVVAGCTAAPSPTAAPTPSADSADPIFATDEEALAAAVSDYGEFEAVSQLIASEGGQGADRIENVATTRYVPQLLDEFEQYSELGLRVAGEASIDSTRLAERSETANGIAVSIYLCRDVSGVRILDAAGADVTPAERNDRTALIAFLVAPPGESQMLVDEVELWSGDDFC